MKKYHEQPEVTSWWGAGGPAASDAAKSESSPFPSSLAKKETRVFLNQADLL